MADAYLLADGWEWHYDDAAPWKLLRVVQAGGGTEVTIPDLLDGSTHLTTIGSGVNTDRLDSTRTITKILGMPASVTTISNYAFRQLTSMTSCVLGANITSLGGAAFLDCSGLTSVNIPSGVTAIIWQTFEYCTSLASIIIPNGITAIGQYAFYGDTALTSITFLGLTAPTTGSGWIDYVPAEARGHAYTDSDFPAPGSAFNGLTMGTALIVPAVTSTAVSSVQAWEQYIYQAVASTTVTWAMTTTVPGVNVSSAGYVYGVFTVTGNASVVITVTDVYGRTGTQSFTVVISVNSLGAPVLKFAVVSDGHYGQSQNPAGERQTDLLSSIAAMGLSTLFDLGDLEDNGTPLASYTAIKAAYVASGLTYYVTPGNHDAAVDISYFTASFPGSTDYVVVIGDVVLIVLDTTIGNQWLTTAQMDFLEETLAEYNGRLVFVMMHVAQKDIMWPEGEADRTRFQAIISANAYHLGGVFFGHAHKAGSTAGDGTYYTYGGTYGQILYSYFPLGYAIVAVFQDGVRHTIKTWYHQIVKAAALPDFTSAPWDPIYGRWDTAAYASEMYLSHDVIVRPGSPYTFTAWLPREVSLYRLRSCGVRGSPTYYDPVTAMGFISHKAQDVTGPDGHVFTSGTSVTVEGMVDVRPLDKVLLPDGTTWPVKSVDVCDHPGGSQPMKVMYL